MCLVFRYLQVDSAHVFSYSKLATSSPNKVHIPNVILKRWLRIVQTFLWLFMNNCATGHNGTINGQGRSWWEKYRKKLLNYTRGPLLQLMWSRDIYISDVTFRDSPFWTLHPYDCQNVVIRNVTILAPLTEAPNTDGIDPGEFSLFPIQPYLEFLLHAFFDHLACNCKLDVGLFLSLHHFSFKCSHWPALWSFYRKCCIGILLNAYVCSITYFFFKRFTRVISRIIVKSSTRSAVQE